jgi:serine/threonine protein kinase
VASHPESLTSERSQSLSGRIAEAAEAFERAWNSESPPTIEEFLARWSGSERAALLVELIMVDVERRWRIWSANVAKEKGAENWAELPTLHATPAKPPLLADYAVRCPEICEASSHPDELVIHEYRVRLKWGDRPSRQEYLDRYAARPALAAALKAVEAQLDQSLLDTANIQKGDSRPATPRLTDDRKDHLPSTVPFDGGATAGSRIGPYKLLEQLGEGGMGSVWLAEQKELVRRTVAIKLIKPGMDSGQVLARFEAERQALALMDHQNIAKVLEAGATPAGQPYFVMELVRGTPITEYCDNEKLTIGERLELFISVCQAIQHAHQKGVIHRDIKPSNVLVALYDGKPVAKVIDFGLAKATGMKLTDNTLHTAMGQILGTIEYMSPEQAEVGQLDIDTRSDIYSLGVLLYELLTGTTPLVRSTLRYGSIVEVLLRIQQEEPPRPSVRVSHYAEGPKNSGSDREGEAPAEPQKFDQPQQIAERRKTDIKDLTRALSGDLDWIALRALDKDRNRRYETANALARDIERHLHDEPVQASPPSARYRVGKIIRKHRLAVSAAATIAAVLLVATGVSIGLAIWALNERSRAIAAEGDAQFQLGEAITARNAEKKAAEETRESNADTDAYANFLVDHVLATARPKGEDGGLGVEVTVRRAIEEAEKKVGEVFKERPRAERIVRGGLGQTWYQLGDWTRAIRDFERAHDLATSQFGPDHRSTLQSMNDLASAYRSAGGFAKAVSLLERTLKLTRVRFGPEDPLTLRTMHNLAIAYESAGMVELWMPLEGTPTLERLMLGPEHRDTLFMKNLIQAYSSKGKSAKAMRLFDETVKSQRAKLGPEDPNTLRSMNSFGNAYSSASDSAKAIPLLEETLKVMRGKLGIEHPDTLRSMNNLGDAYSSIGDSAKAIPLLEETLKLMRANLGPEHPNTIQSMKSLANAYYVAFDFAKAFSLREETQKLQRAIDGRKHPNTNRTTVDPSQANAVHGERQ